MTIGTARAKTLMSTDASPFVRAFGPPSCASLPAFSGERYAVRKQLLIPSQRTGPDENKIALQNSATAMMECALAFL